MVFKCTGAYELLNRFVYKRERAREIIFADGLTGDLNSLGRLYQVWRCVETRARARGSQAGFNHRACRPFAVRAGYVNRRKRPLRIAERLQQRRYPLQAELYRLDFVTERIEVLYRIGIRHYLLWVSCLQSQPAGLPCLFSSLKPISV
jgi:hypothetical protein